jgi:hypothetical protein
MALSLSHMPQGAPHTIHDPLSGILNQMQYGVILLNAFRAPYTQSVAAIYRNGIWCYGHGELDGDKGPTPLTREPQDVARDFDPVDDPEHPDFGRELSEPSRMVIFGGGFPFLVEHTTADVGDRSLNLRGTKLATNEELPNRLCEFIASLPIPQAPYTWTALYLNPKDLKYLDAEKPKHPSVVPAAVPIDF